MEPERKIFLIGKTGDGKSSTGNTILGRKVFTSKAAANSVTAKHVTGHGEVNGRKITVIDTPGFFDTDHEDIETKSEIIKALVECAPEIHAFVLALRVGRYTKHEEEVIETFLNLMKVEDVLKHTVVLFTFGDQLQGQTLEGFVASNCKLQEFIEKCEGRCHVIDNIYWNDRDSGEMSNRVQVNNLLDTIDEMVQKNGCFTNKLLQTVHKAIQEEMSRINDNLTPEIKREKAKEIVHKKILAQVAGAAIGAVIGAFLGIVVVFSASVISLQELKIQLVKAVAAFVTGTTREEAASADDRIITGAVIAERVSRVAVVKGAVEGAISGWKAAEEADSVSDAIIKAAKVNFENAIAVIEKLHQLTKSVQQINETAYWKEKTF